MITDLLPKINYQPLLARLSSAEVHQHKNVKSKPLPIMLKSSQTNPDYILGQKLFEFMAALFETDKSAFVAFTGQLELVDFLEVITPKLSSDMELLTASLVDLCAKIITSAGILTDKLIAAAHECGLRACLLLSVRHCSIQVRLFFITFD